MSATHTHDCDRCTFLGSLGSADLYACIDIVGNSYILRYSSEGPDYYSGADFGNKVLDSIKRSIGGGDEVYYLRMAAIRVCSTGITNLLGK